MPKVTQQEGAVLDLEPKSLQSSQTPSTLPSGWTPAGSTPKLDAQAWCSCSSERVPGGEAGGVWYRREEEKTESAS